MRVLYETCIKQCIKNNAYKDKGNEQNVAAFPE